MNAEQLLAAGAQIGLTEDAVECILPRHEDVHIGRLLPHVENWYVVLSSVGICTRSISRYYNPERVACLLSAATGISWSSKELLDAGKRGWDLIRSLNGREGFDRRNDRFPMRWVNEPLFTSEGESLYIHDVGPGKRRLCEEDLQAVLDEYYNERGWDADRGLPEILNEKNQKETEINGK
jgi:aldehyde:ferredoxin oxidoreductase